MIVAIPLALLFLTHRIHSLDSRPEYCYSTSWSSYFHEIDFQDVKSHLTDRHRIICLGFHPAAALNSGLKTADFYLSAYPLSYHERFTRLIRPELEKNPWMTHLHYSWGNRCYAFINDKSQDLYEIDYDWSQSSQLNISHVLSNKPIYLNNTPLKLVSNPNPSTYLYKLKL